MCSFKRVSCTCVCVCVCVWVTCACASGIYTASSALPHRSPPLSTTLHCTTHTLYCTTLHFTTLHCTALAPHTLLCTHTALHTHYTTHTPAPPPSAISGAARLAPGPRASHPGTRVSCPVLHTYTFIEYIMRLCVSDTHMHTHTHTHTCAQLLPVVVCHVPLHRAH
jgi:hypothetical protein